MKPKVVVCWKWRPQHGYGNAEFTAEHVNNLAAMVRKHYSEPHRFICVTDDAKGIDVRVDIISFTAWPDDQHLREARSPHGRNAPACYPRLRAFHPDIADWFGERFVVLDLDTVITASLDTLWDREEDFVMYRDPTFPKQFNGSMLLMTAGARPEVYTDFHPPRSAAESLAAGYYGSDQGWISYRLFGGEAMFGPEHGVYSYKRNHLDRNPLPKDAVIVFFHGLIKPWFPMAQYVSWVREHYALAP